MCAMAQLQLVNNVLEQPSAISGSYILSTMSSEMISEPYMEGMFPKDLVFDYEDTCPSMLTIVLVASQ